MTTRTRKLAAVVAGMLLAASWTLAPAAQAATVSKTYRPPYTLGPAGGDEYNLIYRDESAGRMAIGRAFPGVSPVVGCYPDPGGGWATFRVSHPTGRTLKSVSLQLDAILEPYSWVSISVRSKRGWLGTTKRQGPFVGDEPLTLRLRRSPMRSEPLTIEFGMQLGDACPQAGGALATFPGVTVVS